MTNDTTADFATALNYAIRDNPLTSALIGAGVLWMFVGNARLGQAARGVARGVTTAGQMSVAGAEAIATPISAGIAGSSVVADGFRHAGDAGRSMAESLGDAASRHLPTRDSLKARVPDAGDFQDSAQPALDALRGVFDRQPLALGAVGLALGAGLAAAFPISKYEKEIMGETSRDMQDQIQSLTADGLDLAKGAAGRVLDAMQNEARKQDLTIDAVAERASDVAAKAQTAAGDAIKRSSTR